MAKAYPQPVTDVLILYTSGPSLPKSGERSATFASLRLCWIIKGFVAAGRRVSVILSVIRGWFEPSAKIRQDLLKPADYPLT